MSVKKVIAFSAIVIILLSAAFLVGTMFTPYSIDFISEEPAFKQRLEESGALAPTPLPGRDFESPEYYQDRMVIYNAFISLETEDIGGTIESIRRLAEVHNGYIAGSSRSTYGIQEKGEITLRIPQDSFQTVIEEIEGYGKLLDENSNSEDVTEQYIDLKARLENLQKQEKRLHEILDFARTVEEILEVERELERVRGEIERLQGQINYLERNVAMSIITVRLLSPPPPFTPPGMDWSETLTTAITGLFLVLRGLTIIIVSLLPLIIIGAIIYYIYKRRKRNR